MILNEKFIEEIKLLNSLDAISFFYFYRFQLFL